MSLYRLIRLAKKTGDRLIVHNEIDDSNVVIMDLDNYERLVDFNDPEDFGSEDSSSFYPTPDPFGTSPFSFDKYPWEDDDEDDDFDATEDEHDWSHISDIMSDRYGDVIPEEVDPIIEEVPPFTPEDENNFSQTETPEVAIGPVYESTTPTQPVVDNHSVPSPAGATVTWQEEALPGDPVFYEEPT